MGEKKYIVNDLESYLALGDENHNVTWPVGDGPCPRCKIEEPRVVGSLRYRCGNNKLAHYFECQHCNHGWFVREEQAKYQTFNLLDGVA